MTFLNNIFATWFYLGRIPKAPGTWGSIGGTILFFGLLFPWYFITETQYNILAHFILTTVLFFLGILSAKKYDLDHDTQDSKEIVIDEVVGVLIALSPVLLLDKLPQDLSNDVMHIVISIFGYNAELIFAFLSGVIMFQFCLFRFFDILKPWPISWVDKNVKGGLGVMLDDVLAGVFAAMVFVAIGYGYHVFFG